VEGAVEEAARYGTEADVADRNAFEIAKAGGRHAGLLRHWQEDLTRNQELAEVMRGLLHERGIQP